MTKKSDAPAIRFKGFSDAWEQRKVSELFRVTRGYVLAATQTETTKTDEKPYPVYSSQTKDKGLMGYYKDYLYEDAITWTTDGANAGTVNYRAGKFYCTNVCGVLLSNEVKANQMIAEALNSVAKGYVSYVGNPKLMNNVMADIVIQIPTQAEEREQLSSIFANLDNLITLHQRECISFTGSAGRLILTANKKRTASSWEQRKLSEITDKVTEKNAGLQYVETFTNSAEFGIISQRDFFDHDIAKLGSLDGYYIVKNEDFVYNPRISTSAPVGPINRNKLGRTGVMSPLYTVFRPHDIDTTYLEYFFKCGYWHSFMNFNGDSGARSDRFSIRDNVFFQMPIPIPDIDEQRKIGELLTCLDNLITLHQRKFEKLTNVKKSMLEKMFPQNGSSYPEIRFKGFTDPWEQRKLEDYLTVSAEKNTGNIYGRSDVLSVSGDYGIVNQIEFQGRSFAGASVSNYGVVQTGDVVYTKSPLNSNPYGIIKTNKGKPGIVSTLYAVYHPKENAFSDFIQVYFEQHARMNNYMHPLVNKGAKNDMKVSAENALKGPVCFPSRIEQESISAFFSVLDNLITLHQRELEKLQNIKKSMLEKMFV